MSKFSFKTSFAKANAKQNRTKIEQAQEDAKEVKSAFLQTMTEKQKAFQQDTDMEFFICIAFQNRKQKEEFLKAKGWDKYGDKYFAAIDIAPHEKVKITIDKNMRKKFKFTPQPNVL